MSSWPWKTDCKTFKIHITRRDTFTKSRRRKTHEKQRNFGQYYATPWHKTTRGGLRYIRAKSSVIPRMKLDIFFTGKTENNSNIGSLRLGYFNRREVIHIHACNTVSLKPYRHFCSFQLFQAGQFLWTLVLIWHMKNYLHQNKWVSIELCTDKFCFLFFYFTISSVENINYLWSSK